MRINFVTSTTQNFGMSTFYDRGLDFAVSEVEPPRRWKKAVVLYDGDTPNSVTTNEPLADVRRQRKYLGRGVSEGNTHSAISKAKERGYWIRHVKREGKEVQVGPKVKP